MPPGAAPEEFNPTLPAGIPVIPGAPGPVANHPVNYPQTSEPPFASPATGGIPNTGKVTRLPQRLAIDTDSFYCDQGKLVAGKSLTVKDPLYQQRIDLETGTAQEELKENRPPMPGRRVAEKIPKSGLILESNFEPYPRSHWRLRAPNRDQNLLGPHAGAEWVRATDNPDRVLILNQFAQDNPNNIVTVWSISQQKAIKTLNLYKANGILSPTLTPQGNWLLTSTSGDPSTFVAYNLENGEKRSLPLKKRGGRVEFSEDGSRMMLRESDNRIVIYDLPSMTESAVIHLPGEGAAYDYAKFSPDGKRLITTESKPGWSAATLKLHEWDLSTARKIREIDFQNQIPGARLQNFCFTNSNTLALSVRWFNENGTILNDSGLVRFRL
jgi:hypothetical protein